MKLIFRLIKIAIIFLIIGGCFYLLINKTFIYDVYKSEVMEDEGIPIKRFMYVIDDDKTNEAKFYTFLSNSTLENMKKDYLDDLELCYGKYYYDKNIKAKPLINGIGYKELYNYFDGLCSKEEAVEKIKQNSRHYAKRQYTFLNHQLNVVWFETDYNNFNNTIEKVSSYIKNN